MKIGMNHGAGGEVMENLIKDTILGNVTKKAVNDGIGLDSLDDGATIPIGNQQIVITTDGHTVNPLFFPGGDIGRIAAAGTINDVSMMGAKPLAITNSMIIQEGFPEESLDTIMKSMDACCQEVDVAIVAGDTKVMESDKLDGIVISTTGLGIVDNDKVIRDSTLEIGDKIIITGTVGDHGLSLMSLREGINFESTLQSDVAPMWGIVEKATAAGEIHAMKDPTRGGFANAINEMADKSGVGVLLQDDSIPIHDEVRGVSDMLGIDPYEVANEGKVVMGVKASDAEDILKAIKKDKYGKNAAIIGEVTDDNHVLVETPVGGVRIMETPIADPVPRVC
ncbi:MULTISPECIES: hydrogenase expression/formation protein HypE [unclassified Methanobrevibacter]|jgi:hydrogenase expression/formation protein HypE|uniref:hydrogenase expression/formation protein HypE n=1 Tax=unclassified Methanobrevibacter TaxID=2638681 RepID=UPI0039B8A9D1